LPSTVRSLRRNLWGMRKTAIALMDEIRGRLEVLESNLPASVDAMTVSRSSKLPFKVLLYREALIWRMAELVRAAFDNFGTENLVAAIVLTRAAVETSAALWYLCAKVGTAVESNDVGNIDKYLMKMYVGVATGATTEVVMPRPVRVGKFLESVEKDIPGFNHQYGILCEYAHPNWAGTALVYSKNDAENRVTYFGKNMRKADNTKLIGTSNLSVALLMFERSYNRITEILPAFTKLCENRLG
jgi:hypothetical protein